MSPKLVREKVSAPPLLYISLLGGKLGGTSTLEELEALLIMESLLELEVMDGDLERKQEKLISQKNKIK